jgi:signal transduction histidine kinase
MLLFSSPMPAALREFLEQVLIDRRLSPEDKARIDAHAEAQTLKIARALMLTACTIGLLWWPVDYLLYGDRLDVLRAFALWRASVIVCCLVYYFTADRFDLLRRHQAVYGTLVGGTMAFIIAATLGALGGVDQPWFASLYFVPIMSCPFLLRPGVRFLGTLLVSVAALAGFFLVHPQNLRHPAVGTSVGLMLFGVMVSMCAGHAMYHWFRLGHVQSLRLDARTRELEALTKGLADRVEARTAELRLLAAHLDKLHETERTALGRELHDELGQLLSGIRLELDLAERTRKRGGDTGPHLMKLGELLDATLDSTRSILSHLRPRILDDFGLVAAVEWLASDTARRSGLDVRFLAEPEEFTVPDDVATSVFRIVQESLTNVLRHARARQVQVSLTQGAEGLVVRVADDGVGLQSSGPRRLGSMGLLGMRERAHALGGSLDLGPSPGGGTLVCVRLPAAVPGREVA